MEKETNKERGRVRMWREIYRKRDRKSEREGGK